MPLINCDAKSLEWVAAAWLSQDPLALEELRREDFDFHADNQRVLGLGEGKPGRHVAKIYLFRLIFGGSAYSYAGDPDFIGVSDSVEFWQRVIDKTYDKYRGLGRWHTRLLDTVNLSGRLEMPTGRVYTFERVRNYQGHMEWPRTQILNYPVQGLGADLMSIVRVSLFKRMRRLGLKSLWVCTVHDSILIDAIPEEVDVILDLMYQVFDAVPNNFQRLFGVEFNVPLRVEIQVGPNWHDMEEIKRKEFYANQGHRCIGTGLEARWQEQLQHDRGDVQEGRQDRDEELGLVCQ